MACPVCQDIGWTCETHPDQPMGHDECLGAGDPCSACNTLVERGIDVPRSPAGFQVDIQRSPNVIDLKERLGRKRWDK